METPSTPKPAIPRSPEEQVAREIHDAYRHWRLAWFPTPLPAWEQLPEETKLLMRATAESVLVNWGELEGERPHATGEVYLNPRRP